MTASKDGVRLAALGDLHAIKTSQGMLQTLFGELPIDVDVLLLCGDLTENGLPEEAQVIAKTLRESVKIPMVAVLGNHDYQSGKQGEVTGIFVEAGITILNGDACEIHGIGFAGVKGFVGGFGPATLSPFGEESIKSLVQEAIAETLKLEAAIARLRTPTSVILLHYSPVKETVIGEPADIYAFLGTSRLEEPINRYPIAAVFHGHAHHGSLEGRTARNIPVYNVALPLLRKQYPGRPSFRVLDVPHDGNSIPVHLPPHPRILQAEHA